MRWKIFCAEFLVLFLAAFFTVQARAAEQKTITARLVSVRVAPQDVTLSGAEGSQHLAVLGLYTDGLERDVTAMARFSLSDHEKGEIDNTGKFVARNPGLVVLRAQADGHSAETTIRIEHATRAQLFTFARDIGGILTKRGCNDTTCHGSAKGRNGFKLSIFAFDPRTDYNAIVNGGTFRVLSADDKPKSPRINLQEPQKSLLLLKPTLSVPHGGGLRFEAGSPDYLAILNWIKAGAPYGDEAEKQGVTIQRVEVLPERVVLDIQGRQQLVVTGYLADGRREDLTGQAQFVSEDSEVADVSDSGVIQARKSGECNVFIRTSGGHPLNVTVGVVQHPIPNYPKLETRNYIDEYVFAKLRQFQMLPSGPSTDEEFLRRVCLDLTGRLPPAKRVREFLADRDPHKRDKLIAILLDSPEYVDYWTFRFSELFRVRASTPGGTLLGTQAFEDWVTNSIAVNKPYNQMVRERIAAQGLSAPGRSLFHIEEMLTPEMVMPEVIRVYMGRRIECAQCHNHPFETWTQNQFWGLAAFYGGTTQLRNGKQFFEQNDKGYVVFDSLGQKPFGQTTPMMVVNPRTEHEVAPAYLDGKELPKSQWADPRVHLAEWVVSHPYFAEAAVNRIWGNFFVRGIVDPVDDFRSTNPPTNPELLKALARDFRESGYDLRRLMRTIVQSRTYQLSGTPNESNKNDKVDYSHALPRPLDAAILLDAISSATGTGEEFHFEIPGEPLAGAKTAPLPGMHAVQMEPDLCPSQFMDAFGRSMRQSLPVGSPKPNLPEALDTLAGADFTSRISQSGGRLDQMIRNHASDAEIIDAFYLAGLTRLPTPREKQRLVDFLAQRGSDHQVALSRLVWAILNSREFAYNH